MLFDRNEFAVQAVRSNPVTINDVNVVTLEAPHFGIDNIKIKEEQEKVGHWNNINHQPARQLFQRTWSI